MTNLNDLLFPVENVSTESICMPANSEYSRAIIGSINNENRILNVCSDRYELVPNAEIFPAVRQVLINSGIEFEEKYNMIDNARFYADYTLKTQAVSVGTNGDKMFPKISVQHSYNGMSKYQIIFGWFRLICSNGLVIPVEEKAAQNLHITGKHTKSIVKSFEILTNHLEQFIHSDIASKLTEKYDQLADKWVESWEDRVTEVMLTAGWSPYKAGKQKKDAPKELSENTEAIFNVIRHESEILTGSKVNDWLVYNGINNVLHNDDFNSAAPEIRMKTDQKVLTALLAS